MNSARGVSRFLREAAFVLLGANGVGRYQGGPTWFPSRPHRTRDAGTPAPHVPLQRQRGTSITHQLELAIRGHVEADLVQDHLPVVKPVLEKVISENLDATITTKIDEVKERLAGLLAKNALDTAALYLIESRRWSPEEKQALRKAAVEHVRGRTAELHADVASSEELAAARRQVEQLAAQLKQREVEMVSAVERHRAELRDLEQKIHRLQAVAPWCRALLERLEAEWVSSSGLLGRRRPFQAIVGDHEHRLPRPEGA